jgi:glycosyltransferase involved in cell wall biosynthesis
VDGHRRIRALFVIPTLGLGGAELALRAVLQRLDRDAFEPRLCVLQPATAGVSVPGDVPVTELSRRSRWSFPRVVLELAGAIRRHAPEVVIGYSGTANFAVLLAARLLRRRPAILVTEHIAPAQMYRSVEEPYGWIKELLIRALYRSADAVVAVSYGVASELEREYGLAEGRIGVAHTPVEIERLRDLAGEPPSLWPERGPVVVSVSRLTPQKNVALLLRALARLPRARQVSAVIVGAGSERPLLERLARELEVRVLFTGPDANPYRYMARADAFVLSSDFEGFGVVLVEALSLGVPVVSTDCPSGPREILDSGEHGVLVAPGGVEALAAALERILSDESLRERLRAGGPRRAEVFSAPRGTQALEREIEAVLRRRRISARALPDGRA